MLGVPLRSVNTAERAQATISQRVGAAIPGLSWRFARPLPRGPRHGGAGTREGPHADAPHRGLADAAGARQPMNTFGSSFCSRIMNAPMRLSPAMMPDEAATVYFLCHSGHNLPTTSAITEPMKNETEL